MSKKKKKTKVVYVVGEPALGAPKYATHNMLNNELVDVHHFAAILRLK